MPASAEKPLSYPARREGSLDILKLVLAICVVGLHGHALADVNLAFSEMLVEGVFRIAVPTFFLISGFFLARMTLEQTLAWLRRLFVLYAVWMAVYVDFWFDPATLTARQLVRTLVVGYHHLWFLPALMMAAMLLYPLRDQSTRRLLMLAGGTFAIGLCLQYAGNHHLSDNPALDKRLNTLWVYRNFLFMGFPFVALGFLLARHEESIRLSRGLLVAMMIAGFALLILEAGLNHAYADLSQSLDLLVILPVLCPVILLWTRTHSVTWNTRQVAQISTGIYLTHMLVLHALHRWTDWTATPKTIAAILMSALLSWLGLLLWQSTALLRSRALAHAAGRITARPRPLRLRTRRGS